MSLLTTPLLTIPLMLVYHRADFPEIMGHVQPLDDLILSQDNVQVSEPIATFWQWRD